MRRFLLLFVSCAALAQVTPADYERARTLRDKFQGLAVNIPGPVNWIEKTERFWYRKSVKGGVGGGVLIAPALAIVGEAPAAAVAFRFFK